MALDNFQDTLETEGIASQHGHHYQVKLLTQAIVRAINAKHDRFRLATEFKSAGKFDDIVYQYKERPESTWKFRLIQLKHKEGLDDNKSISGRDLFAKGGVFSFRTYLNSFQTIQEYRDVHSRYSIFSGCEIEDIMILTNGQLTEEAVMSYFEPIESIDDDKLFRLSPTVACHNSNKYSISQNKFEDLKISLADCSNLQSLVAELGKNLISGTSFLKGEKIKDYFYPLIREVFEVILKPPSQWIMKFRPTFFNDQMTSDFYVGLNSIVGDLTRFRNIEFDLKSFKDFIPVANPQIDRIDQFAREFSDLLNQRGSNRSKILITRNSPFPFLKNVKLIAGHVLIKSCNQIRFRSKFLTISEPLPDHVGQFRDKLKNYVPNFEELYFYEFEFDWAFQTVDEFSYDRGLPTYLSDQHFSDFFSKFRFVDNYLSRRDLEFTINPEFEKLFKQLGIWPHRAMIESEMFAWMASRTGSFYTLDNRHQFFTKITNCLMHFSSDGANDLFFAYSSSPIQFDPIDPFIGDFMAGPDQILNVVCPRLELAQAMTVQSFKSFQRSDDEFQTYKDYSFGHGYVFYDLKALKSVDLLEKILSNFNSRNLCNILFILCNANFNPEEFLNPFYEILRDKLGKRLVLISENGIMNQNHLQEFSITYREKKFDDFDQEDQSRNLTTSSRNEINHQQIIFQGHHSTVGEMIGSDEIIPADMLQRIALNERIIEIGYPLAESRGYKEEFYIDRQFVQVVQIQREYFEDKSETGKILISHQPEELNLLNIHIPGLYRHVHTRLIEDRSIIEKEFQELCDKFPGKNVHLLEFRGGRLIWKRTKGLIKALANYRVMDQIFDGAEDILIESEMVDRIMSKKFVIIADTPGSGKSTVIDDLIKTVKGKDLRAWTTRIDFNLYTEHLNDCLKYDRPIILEKLLNSNDKTRFHDKTESLVYKKCLERGQVFLFLDGYDEVSPRFTSIILDFLEILYQTSGINICVTTRTTVRSGLEGRINHFAYSLLLFSPDEQEILLFKYWNYLDRLEQLSPLRLKRALVDDSERHDRLRQYAKEVLEKFTEMINDEVKKFTGIPLQTLMVAEIFRERKVFQEFVQRGKKLSFRGLYLKFVDKIYHDILGGKMAAVSNSIVENALEVGKGPFLKTHQQLAFRAIFPESEYKLKAVDEVKDWNKKLEDITLGSEKRGIVDGVIDGRPYFIHRTFAEHFIAEYFLEHFKNIRDKKDLNIFFHKILCEREFNVIRSFFDDGLHDIMKSIEGSCKQYEPYVVEQFINEIYSDRWQTSVKVASEENMFNIMNVICMSLKRNPKFWLGMINSIHKENKDFKLHSDKLNISRFMRRMHYRQAGFRDIGRIYSATHFAIDSGGTDIVKFLLQNGALSNKEIHSADREQLFDTAVMSRRTKMLELVVARFQNSGVNCSEFFATAASSAVENNDLDQLEVFLDNGFDINHKEAMFSERILLLTAAYQSSVETIKFLISRNADLRLTDIYGVTMMHYAAKNANPKVIEYLHKDVFKGDDSVLNWTDDAGTVPIRFSMLYNARKTFDYIIAQDNLELNQVEIDGETPVFAAAQCSALQVEALIKKGANYRLTDKSGKTILHIVGTHCTWNVLNVVLDKMLDLINHQDNLGNTVLHYACGNEFPTKFLQLLIENGSEVNIKNLKGLTPIHFAINASDYNTMKVLLEHKADTTVEIEEGETLVDYVVENSTDDSIMLHLLDLGISFKSADQIFQFGVDNDSLDLIKRLDYHDIEYAVENANIEVVKYLIEEVKVPCSINQLILLSALGGNQEVLEYLLCVEHDSLKLLDGTNSVFYHAINGKCSKDILDLLFKKFDSPQNLLDDLLSHSISLNNFEYVKYFADKGANVNQPINSRLCFSNKSQNLFKLAQNTPKEFYEKLKIVRFLLVAGCQFDDDQKVYAMKLIAAGGSVKEFKSILSKIKLKQENVDDDGRNLLHYAAQLGNLDIVRYLVNVQKFDVNSKSLDGSTALHLAVQNNYLDILCFLIYRGADLNNFSLLENVKKNYYGDTFKTNILYWLVYCGAN